MIKSWLITTSAPYLGTDQHYAAYAEDSQDIYDYLYDSGWFDEECQALYDSYAFRLEDGWEDEWEETQDDYEDHDAFMDAKYTEWCEDCGLDVSECPEEDFSMYVPGGDEDGELEVIYDEREK